MYFWLGTYVSNLTDRITLHAAMNEENWQFKYNVDDR